MEQTGTYGIEGPIRPECLQSAQPSGHEIRLVMNMAGGQVWNFQNASQKMISRSGDGLVMN